MIVQLKEFAQKAAIAIAAIAVGAMVGFYAGLALFGGDVDGAIATELITTPAGVFIGVVAAIFTIRRNFD